MTSTTFIHGLSRVLNCSKVQVTAAGLVTTWFAVRYAAGDLPPTQRASLWVAFIGAVAVQLREIINAWTEEDVAGLARPPTNDPPADRNSEIRMTNVESNPNDQAQTIQPTRSTGMPTRTKLPLIMIAFTLIALFATGCQTSPELTTYREGLHQVDEPLYQAHLLLMADAVKANLRTAADQQVVQQGINAAEGLYQQSRATEAAGATIASPATQP